MNTISLNAYSVPPNSQETSQKVKDVKDKDSYISLDLVFSSKELGSQLYQCYLKYKMNLENMDDSEKLKIAFNFLITECLSVREYLNEGLNYADEFFRDFLLLVEEMDKEKRIAELKRADVGRDEIFRIIRVNIFEAIRKGVEITKEDMILKVINTIARDEIAIGEITEDEIKSIVFKYLPDMEKDLDKLNMKFQEFQAKIKKEQ